MSKIAILYCKKVKDHSCIACAKCYKGIGEKNGEFGRYDDIELVAMTDCGDCPGLVVPKVKLLNEITNNLDRPIEKLHLGTCVKLAMETAECPIGKVVLGGGAQVIGEGTSDFKTVIRESVVGAVTTTNGEQNLWLVALQNDDDVSHTIGISVICADIQ